MILHTYAIVALAGIAALGIAVLGTALRQRPIQHFDSVDSWKQYRFGFTTYALIFLAFDMEMIFMYPWAVVFGGIGLKAFLDMLVFIALLGGGVAYAWGMGGLEWES